RAVAVPHAVVNPGSRPRRRFLRRASRAGGERSLNLAGKKILVLGGYGLVGIAVCLEILKRRRREIQIHSLREGEAEQARTELGTEAEKAGTTLTTSFGDLFGLAETSDRRAAI